MRTQLPIEPLGELPRCRREPAVRHGEPIVADLQDERRETLRTDVTHELLRVCDVLVDGHRLQRRGERRGVEPDLAGNLLQRRLANDVLAALVVRVLYAA